MKNLSKNEIMALIRKRLKYDDNIVVRHAGQDFDITKEHRRFEMSGYDGRVRGDCTLHNTEILNEFACLGIYDYTDYLFLDFYKGVGRLYMRYFNEDENLCFDFCGWTTTEIIYFIFEKTILSEKKQRRRW